MSIPQSILDIPHPLPVGISRTMIAPGRKKDKKPKQPYYTAHVGYIGLQMAKNFSINKHGELEAYNLARKWRNRTVRELKAAKLTSSRTGRPGKRKVSKQPR